MDTTQQARGQRLSDHETVSGTTVHGWPSVGFGLLLVAAGVGTSILVLADSSVNATTLYLTLVACSTFVVGGLALVTHGVAGLRRMSVLRRERARHPEEPWRWDHRWDEAGIRDDTVRRLTLWGYRALFFAMFMLPFNWLVFVSGDLAWFGMVAFGLVTVLFDLLVVYVFYRFVKSFLQYVRHGVGAIRYARFPFFLGEPLEVSFVPTDRMSGLRELKATLRCVEERYEKFDFEDSDSSTTVIPYELYSDTHTFTGNPDTVGRSLDVNLSFALPDNRPTTKLGERPPTYWELEIEAEAPGVDYAATFLLPVYSRRPD
ncbi:MAG: hypothetical protein ACR2HO_00880 [Rubrobacteraceae bacterium]|nr:hypothetical protein [Rubrobacter sp.]